ncbi:MAG TPA: hypothetical protein VGN37_26265 [Actinocatenispora sp.]
MWLARPRVRDRRSPNISASGTAAVTTRDPPRVAVPRIELAAHPVHEDLQVQLAHPAEQRLPGLRIRAYPEARILRGESVHRNGKPFLAGRRRRVDRRVQHPLRERHRLQQYRSGRVAELVEGPSDLAYLDMISRRLRDQGREGLDERWRILPAGGASNVPAFVSLLGQRVSVTVLLDSGTEGGGKVEAAIKANKIAGKRVVFVGSVLDQKHSDIEDLFTVGDYLGLYNEAFGKRHKAADLPHHPDRLVLRLEKLDGKFDHWRPAEVLLRNPSKVERLSQTTLANFERLARRINETHQ